MIYISSGFEQYRYLFSFRLMKMKSYTFLLIILGAIIMIASCGGDEPAGPINPRDLTGFYFGADLSFVNQILDQGGVYNDEGAPKNPYAIFKERGTKLVRLRLWHNPTWTKTVYTPEGDQLYNDVLDVEKAIQLSKAQGMEVLLDFHYSDIWADPGNQKIPAAWQEIISIEDLEDSVYNYTKNTLSYLQSKNLLPEFVQLGNETNCGMLYTDAPAGFPSCNVCEGSFANMATVLNKAIQAVNEVAATSTIDTKIILHVADPKNVEWWFDNIISAGVADFDIVGFSYYPLWHTTVTLDQLSDKIAFFKTRYSREVMILETAYPWTIESNDSYNNHFGNETAIVGYPKTEQGQLDMLKKITQETLDGGGLGVVYWEPAWITSSMKDLWGTGSSWENCTFFDFDGNPLKAFGFMKAEYK